MKDDLNEFGHIDVRLQHPVTFKERRYTIPVAPSGFISPKKHIDDGPTNRRTDLVAYRDASS